MRSADSRVRRAPEGAGGGPIRTDGSNGFADHTVRNRLPAVLDDVLASDRELSRSRREALETLRRELTEDRPLAMFPPPAPDWELWQECFSAHAERMAELSDAPPSPLNAEWFFLEHFFYRKVLAATDWWGNGHDPFRAAKRRELKRKTLRRSLERTLEAAEAAAPSASSGADEPDPLAILVGFTLWGNRMDLSYSAVAELGHDDSDERWLLKNDLAQARSCLEESRRRARAVHIVADNAGTELAADLALCDYLLASGERETYLHVKLHPTFVSDATAPDVRELVAEMRRQRPGAEAGRVAELGERLHGHLAAGRLRIVPDYYWNSPDFFDSLPQRLSRPFSEAALLVLKGDMAYRRLLGDAIPDPTAPLASVAPLLPAPVLLVRTMKGDPVAGLDAAAVSALDNEDPQWRVNGRRGLLQLVAGGG